MITMLIWSNISQTDKKIAFIEKSYIKCGAEASPRLFSKKIKLSIFLDQKSEMFYSLFFCMSKSRSTKIC